MNINEKTKGIIKIMIFKYIRKINYYETDRMGIVHHSNYIRFLEEARCRVLKKIGLSIEKIEETGFTIPTLEVNCKYKYHDRNY